MDLTFFRYLNSFAGHGGMTDQVVVFLASYLQYVLGAALIVAALWPRRVRMAIAAIISAAVARGLVKPAILLFVHRARPYIALSSVHNIIGPQTGEEYQSFPSGHAIFFFALATAVYLYDRRLGWWFFFGATLMGIARIIGGIHWPSDILGGALIGIVVGWALVRLVPPLRPRVLINR